MIIEMHSHSSEDSRCSEIHLEELVKENASNKIEGLCITEHDRFPDLDVLTDLETRYHIRMFPGIERSLPWGHFLIFGVHKIKKEKYIKLFEDMLENIKQEETDSISARHMINWAEDLISTDKYLPGTVEELGDYVQENNGCIIRAHPFDERSLLRITFNEFVDLCGSIDIEQFIEYIQKTKKHESLYHFLTIIDGIEIRNGFIRQRGLEEYFSERIADCLNKAKVAGSDIHNRHMVAKYVMDFDIDIKDSCHLAEQIKKKQGFQILDRNELAQKLRHQKKRETAEVFHRMTKYHWAQMESVFLNPQLSSDEKKTGIKHIIKCLPDIHETAEDTIDRVVNNTIAGFKKKIKRK